MSAPPLANVKVLEVAGLAPGPYCGLILADFGADVVRVDRVGASYGHDRLTRGKRSIALNFKQKTAVQTLLKMIENCDVFIEPFRPGVAERLGFGPEVALKINPKLIYARLTGWGQKGPYAHLAGHDINYIAISGALSLFGRKNEAPIFPVNILGDFAGGSLMCAFGILLALFERTRSGKGQVVDAAMVDGAAYLISFVTSMYHNGLYSLERGTNLIDSGAPFYETYKTKDNKYMAVGAIEPQFYALLIKGLGLNEGDLPPQNDQDAWPQMKKKFQEIFLSKTQQEWTQTFQGTDACVSPVLSLTEVTQDPHAQARDLFMKDPDGQHMPAPAPRLSRSPSTQVSGKSLMPELHAGTHTRQVLKEYGFQDEEIIQLEKSGAIGSTDVKAAL